jgi:hypothetical protein
LIDYALRIRGSCLCRKVGTKYNSLSNGAPLRPKTDNTFFPKA